jgi:hypothetical protein
MFFMVITRLPVKALAAGKLIFTTAVLVRVRNAPPSAVVNVMSVVVVVTLRYAGALEVAAVVCVVASGNVMPVEPSVTAI